jgi:hypothetical protein
MRLRTSPTFVVLTHTPQPFSAVFRRIKLDPGYTTARMGCELDVYRQIRPTYFGQYAAMLAPTKNPA